ncbi:MAG: GH92 family glycosyl hydrolase [Candidatus Cryptobacteroides sp.]
MNNRLTTLLLSLICLVYPGLSFGQDFWRIGEKDGLSTDLALGPDGYNDFLEWDFGFEDNFYVLGGFSDAKRDFPYVLPGPADTWGGTWSTAGWRTHQINLLFEVSNLRNNPSFVLDLNLLDFSKRFFPRVKVSVNDEDTYFELSDYIESANRKKQPYRYREPITDTLSLSGNSSDATPVTLSVPVENIKEGTNQIVITILDGAWIMFDNVCMSIKNGSASLVSRKDAIVLDVVPAGHQFVNPDIQPLLVDVLRLDGKPDMQVLLDGREIYRKKLVDNRSVIEAPMPAVTKKQKSKYVIKINGKTVGRGEIVREPKPLGTPADYVDTRIGTAHSRWMIAPGPWMPFGMVKLSPDNQNAGWQAGYQPSFESIGCFSHIHEWTVGGLGIMPVNGKLQTWIGTELDPDSGYRSRMDKRSEEAGIGYYKAYLTDYDIWTELTATTRAGFMKFTYPKDRGVARIMADLHPPIEKDFQLLDAEVIKVSDYRIEGYSHHLVPQMWSDDACQDYKVNFVLEFNVPITRIGHWVEDRVTYSDTLKVGNCKRTGVFLEFDVPEDGVIMVRSGISPVSIQNAGLNLKTELSDVFGWDFEAVCQNQKDCWNDIFERLRVKSDNRLEKMKFYNNLYRALCGRNTWSDVNGEWVSTDGKIRKVTGKDDVMLSCDAFWNSFWNLNPLWNLIVPEWSSRWVRSQLNMYDANGWLAKGPAALNYIPVMVAEHEIPLMVSAYQMGIRDYDTEKMFEAVKHQQTEPGRKLFKGFAGNRDLAAYMKYHYVPSDLGRFSNTMEYSFDDWTVGQLAKSMGKTVDYINFNERGYWWKNAIGPEGYCQMRTSDGNWVTPFDPFKTGANRHYVEGNAWQLTYFVPQDVSALVDILGKEEFVKRLEWGFEQSEPWRYNAPRDQYWDYPIVQGNQQSMHFAYLFNWAGCPWLTQKWSRSILDRYYGCGVGNAYLGDEDQGQMSAWAVLSSIGLFQTDGGTNASPFYEIGSPVFEEVTIDLGERYGRGKSFVIKADNASKDNIYIQEAFLNGKKLDSFKFPASELLKGGELRLVMSDKPNYEWGHKAGNMPREYVDPNIGSVHSRWFFYTPASVPFGMAKPAPSTNGHLGTKTGWGAVGYDGRHSSIEGFPNFHEFQIGGLLYMPTVGEIVTVPGELDSPESGYRSSFKKENEKASPGYYSVVLDKYGVKAELTASERTSLQRYSFPESSASHIIIDAGHIQGESGPVVDAEITVTGSLVEGRIVTEPVYTKTYQPGAVVNMYFSALLSKEPITAGIFIDDKYYENTFSVSGTGCGVCLTFDTSEGEAVTVTTGLSYTSIENARLNREQEVGLTDFDTVRARAEAVWDRELGRIRVEGGKESDKVKFYTALYHALLGRGLASDVNGAYPRNDGTIGYIPAGEDGKPLHNHYNTDAIWGAFWNLTQLWTLAYPSYLSDWIKSQLLVYQDSGWLADGIACSRFVSGVGTNYVGLVISAAYNCGIRDFDVETAYAAVIKNELEWKNRPEGAGKADVKAFVERGFSPTDRKFKPATVREGSRQGASHTLEYCFSASAAAQFAESIGKAEECERLKELAGGWERLFDKETGYIHPLDCDGKFIEPFDIFAPWIGFQEGNAVQYTYYVPHDIDRLVALVGKDKFNEDLNRIFEESRKNIFGGGKKIDAFSGLSNLYNHGNQPCLHIPWLFSHSGRPDLTEKWIRTICDEFYGTDEIHGYGYGQDEDQGQLGGWFVMAATGLFDVTGLTSANPRMQVIRPLFDKVEITLDNKYHKGDKLVIRQSDTDEIQVDGKPLEGNFVPFCKLNHGVEIIVPKCRK